jgi:hypothetical protein
MSAEQSAAPSNAFANWIGAGVVLFLCGTMGFLTYAVITRDLPDKTLNIVIYILGFVTGKLSTVVDWSFGTNSASKKKDDIIAQATDTAAKAQGALAPLASTTATATTTANGDVKDDIPAGATAQVHAKEDPAP